MTDLSRAESLDRNLRGLEKHVRAQVLLQKPTKTEDTLQLREIYDPLVFGFSDRKHYKKPGAEFPRTAHLLQWHGGRPSHSREESQTDSKAEETAEKRRLMLLLSQGRLYHKDLPQEVCSSCEANKLRREGALPVTSIPIFYSGQPPEDPLPEFPEFPENGIGLHVL